MVGGTLALGQFTSIRYESYDRRARILSKEEMENLEADERLQDMHKEFKDMLESTKKDWEQRRVERPW
jgi:hypothetical protein